MLDGDGRSLEDTRQLRLAKLRLKPTSYKEHGYLFSGNELDNKEHVCLFFDAEGADAQWPANSTGEGEREDPEGLPDTSSSRVSDYDGPGPDLSFGPKIPWQRLKHNSNGRLVSLCRTRAGRSPGASVMDRQIQEPRSPQKKDIHAPSESASSYLKRDTHAPFKTLAKTWF